MVVVVEAARAGLDHPGWSSPLLQSAQELEDELRAHACGTGPYLGLSVIGLERGITPGKYPPRVESRVHVMQCHTEMVVVPQVHRPEESVVAAVLGGDPPVEVHGAENG